MCRKTDSISVCIKLIFFVFVNNCSFFIFRIVLETNLIATNAIYLYYIDIRYILTWLIAKVRTQHRLIQRGW